MRTMARRMTMPNIDWMLLVVGGVCFVAGAIVGFVIACTPDANQ